MCKKKIINRIFIKKLKYILNKNIEKHIQGMTQLHGTE